MSNYSVCHLWQTLGILKQSLQECSVEREEWEESPTYSNFYIQQLLRNNTSGYLMRYNKQMPFFFFALTSPHWNLKFVFQLLSYLHIITIFIDSKSAEDKLSYGQITSPFIPGTSEKHVFNQAESKETHWEIWFLVNQSELSRKILIANCSSLNLQFSVKLHINRMKSKIITHYQRLAYYFITMKLDNTIYMVAICWKDYHNGLLLPNGE